MKLVLHTEKNWNFNIARKWVSDNFNIEYSNRGMLQVLHRLNLSYTRPKYTLEKADIEKQENFRKDFKVKKICNYSPIYK